MARVISLRGKKRKITSVTRIDSKRLRIRPVIARSSVHANIQRKRNDANSTDDNKLLEQFHSQTIVSVIQSELALRRFKYSVALS